MLFYFVVFISSAIPTVNTGCCISHKSYTALHRTTNVGYFNCLSCTCLPEEYFTGLSFWLCNHYFHSLLSLQTDFLIKQVNSPTLHLCLSLQVLTAIIARLCHQYLDRPDYASMQSGQALHYWLLNSTIFIQTSLKMTMASSKINEGQVHHINPIV